MLSLGKFNKEFQAITQADAIILLPPLGRGSHIEIGYALALKKQIYWFGEPDPSVMAYHLLIQVPTHQDLVNKLKLQEMINL